ncbi:MAG TPA: ABC transporter permease [Actinomycetota bacterium]
MEQFIAFTIIGVVTGSVYAIAASGLVVTYVTSGIFNVAHGAIGMLMAFTYWELRVHQNWPAPLALIVVVFVIAPLFGALIERTLIRKLRDAPVATSLVVTVALMVFLIGAAQGLWTQSESRQLIPFFSPGGFLLSGVFVTWHETITILTAGAVAIALWFILSRTRTGVAMRAVVDDRDLAALNGARPFQVSMLSWAMGASLASIAGILLAPALQLNVTVLTFLVINAYAAAMVGRLRSLPLTFLGAMMLGLAESYVTGYVQLGGAFIGLRPSLPTIFLFVVLLTMPEARLRAGRLLRTAAPPVPGRNRSLAGAGILVGVAFLLSFGMDAVWLVRGGQALAFGMIMLSLVLLSGYAGQVSLCQMTFAGLGAFAMAKVGADGSPVGLLAAIVLAGAVGALVALPALRLQGLYLALATMAFAVLMDNMFFPDRRAFGTLGNLEVSRLKLPGLSFEGLQSYFVLLAIAFALSALLTQAIRRGPFGRLLAAMRDSPVACATLGLSLTRTKLTVFAISAALAGLGGAMFGGLRNSAGATDFLMLQSLPVLLLVVVGGITTAGGALIGGIALAMIPVIQDFVGTIDGLNYLLAGLAALSIGRSPNGIAAMLSADGRPFKRRAAATQEPPPLAPGQPEEVTPVVAAPS